MYENEAKSAARLGAVADGPVASGSALTARIERIQGIREMVIRAGRVSQETADRLLGQVPQETSGLSNGLDGNAPLFSVLDENLDFLENVAREAMHQADRLSQL